MDSLNKYIIEKMRKFLDELEAEEKESFRKYKKGEWNELAKLDLKEIQSKTCLFSKKKSAFLSDPDSDLLTVGFVSCYTPKGTPFEDIFIRTNRYRPKDDDDGEEEIVEKLSDYKYVVKIEDLIFYK